MAVLKIEQSSTLVAISGIATATWPPRGRDLEVGGLFASRARPPTDLIVAFIDEHRDYTTAGPGVGRRAVCATLQVAPSICYVARSRPPSPRAVRDAVTMPVLLGTVRRSIQR